MSNIDKFRERLKGTTEKIKKIKNSALKNEKIKGFTEQLLKYTTAHKKIIRIVGIIIVLWFVVGQVKGYISKNHKAASPPRIVKTAISEEKTVPIYVDSFGTVSSPENVDIKAQVTGKIIEVNFTQGQEVSIGQLLFTIEPDQYENELVKAEAALEQDMVQLQLKTSTLQRNKSLIEKELISQQEFETYSTEVSSLDAQIELDKAEIELARINLSYCYIKSPINGVTGKRQVDVGNIVSANTGPVLVNVKKISELYLDFTLPERYLVKVRDAMEKNILDVRVTVPGDEDKTYSGKLEFIDNKVDDVGTFMLRAIVENKDSILWAGQFVGIRLILGNEKDAVLVPSEAPQIGKNGYYIFVVSPDNKADLRMVTVGSKQGDDVVIEKGVVSGEKVVTVGQMGLSPGALVVELPTKSQEDSGQKGQTKK